MNKKPVYKKKALLLAAAAAALPLALGACGSGGGPAADPATPAGDPGTSAAQSGQVQFAQCMTQNGVPWQDPVNGHFVFTGGSNPKNNPNYSAALAKCQHYLGPGGLGGGQSSQNEQAELAFAQCMQGHGVNVPDPQNGALSMTGVDPNSPAFKTAYGDCKSKLPGNGQGLRVGGQG